MDSSRLSAPCNKINPETLTDAILYLCKAMKTSKGTWRELELVDSQYSSTLDTVLNVQEFNKIAITSHSTRMEGSTLTLSEAVNLIEKGIPATGKPIDHQNMVLDHYEALEFVLERASKKSVVDLPLIKSIASKTMRRTGRIVNSVLGNTDETLGELRRVNVSAGGKYFVDQSKVLEMLDRLILNIGKNMAQVKSVQEIYTFAFETHFDLVSIHPFTDGNGRVSRLLMNFIEAYHHKPLTLVHQEDRATYFDSLKDSDKSKSTQPIVEFLARQHIKFLTSQIVSYQKGIKAEVKAEEKKPIEKDKTPGYSMFF